MMMTERGTAPPAAAGVLSDEEVIARVRAGDVNAFEGIMRRYNQRLYRAARSILRDEREAEDVVQETYVRAYAQLHQFEGRAAFSTWLTRIAVHEAITRARQRGRFDLLGDTDPDEDRMRSLWPASSVEDETASHELAAALEASIDALPDAFRTVFVLREIEELSTSETAALLDLREETVKTRLHRARALLRKALDAGIRDAYTFGNARCDRIVTAVLVRIRGEGGGHAETQPGPRTSHHCSSSRAPV
jgi:RNA polymerase sigma-70 factor, ECF subfamily